MRIQLLAIPFIVAAGCTQQSSAPVPVIPAASAGTASAVRPSAEASNGGEVLVGTVLEKLDAKQYSYLRLQTPTGEVWAAVPKSSIALGAQARIAGAMWMQDFKSPTMDRTWARIAFGSLEGDGAAAPTQPGRSAGMFAQAAMGQTQVSSQLAGPGSPHAPAPDGAPISVARASGKDGHTIAEVYAQKAALKDQVVRVSGKVVKETDHVLGKNWLHLRDGSGEDADLAFATDDASAVGQTVVLSGVVHLERDLGAGYHYEVLIEDAHLDPK